jgi:hypothetical protein
MNVVDCLFYFIYLYWRVDLTSGDLLFFLNGKQVIEWRGMFSLVCTLFFLSFFFLLFLLFSYSYLCHVSCLGVLKGPVFPYFSLYHADEPSAILLQHWNNKVINLLDS